MASLRGEVFQLHVLCGNLNGRERGYLCTGTEQLCYLGRGQGRRAVWTFRTWQLLQIISKAYVKGRFTPGHEEKIRPSEICWQLRWGWKPPCRVEWLWWAVGEGGYGAAGLGRKVIGRRLVLHYDPSWLQALVFCFPCLTTLNSPSACTDELINKSRGLSKEWLKLGNSRQSQKVMGNHGRSRLTESPLERWHEAGEAACSLCPSQGHLHYRSLTTMQSMCDLTEPPRDYSRAFQHLNEQTQKQLQRCSKRGKCWLPD